MLRGTITQTELITRIDGWRQEVEKTTDQKRSQDSKPHGMKLRSSHTRRALAKVSGNPCSKKRKASAITKDKPSAENVEEVARRPRRGRPAKKRQSYIQGVDCMEDPSPTRRPRGRPPKAVQVTNPLASDIQILSGPSHSLSTRSSPKKGSRSPGKRGQITRDQQISDAAIDMDYLEHCDPKVIRTTFSDLKEEQVEISSAVEDLFEELKNVPIGVIPSALQVASSLIHRQRGLKLANNFSA